MKGRCSEPLRAAGMRPVYDIIISQNSAGFFHGYEFSYDTEIINSYSLLLFLDSFGGISFYQLIQNTEVACFLNYNRNLEDKDTLQEYEFGVV